MLVEGVFMNKRVLTAVAVIALACATGSPAIASAEDPYWCDKTPVYGTIRGYALTIISLIFSDDGICA